MLGNKLGWMLSLALLLMVWLVIYIAEQKLAMTDPTPLTTTPGALDKIKLPQDPRNLRSDPTDAGGAYRDAIGVYQQDPAPYKRMLSESSTKVDDAAKLPAFGPLLAARTSAKATILADSPEKYFANIYRSSSFRTPDLFAVRELGVCLLRLGDLYLAANNKSAARDCFDAALTLAIHLMDERLTLSMFDAGYSLASDASFRFKALKDNNPANAAIEKWWTSLEAWRKASTKFEETSVRVVDLPLIGAHAGDTANLASNSQDRMWRVEGILQLGRVKFAGRTRGDQRGANRILQTLSQSQDPVIAAAAKAAAGLTVEGYRGSGN